MTAPLLIGTPEPGHYRMRLAKGAVWAPVLITRPCGCTIGGEVEHEWTPACDRYPRLRALVCGWEQRDPLQIWNHCHPIEASDYRFMLADFEWCVDNAPHLPEANPRRPVDLNRLPPVF